MKTPSTEFGTVPAAAVVSACLRAQSGVPARSGAARAFGRSPLSAESRSWYVGALGELHVAEQLARLGSGWTILHSVPVGDRGSDIDHVVVGAAGVFTINTKFHEDAKVWVGSRRLLLNGQKTDHLRNSRYEAQRVARALSAAVGTAIAVHPAIVIVGARSITIKEQPGDITVLRASELVRWLRRRRAILDPDTSGRLAETLASRRFWQTDGVTPEEPVDMAAFGALRREVNAARRVRGAWVLAGGATLLAVAATLTTNALGMLGL
ncbi:MULTISPECIES: nuclease-related domain-containing protein [Microbacterium]|uniref:nuclease-related domain-containing protein n=1 Tax=Microbacterium TaxID=33882 RepID=UPI00146D7967|nr:MULTISPECIES: nuclease-related domain-containing protein [Microbacterium]